MGPLPSKRHRKLVVSSSEDEENGRLALDNTSNPESNRVTNNASNGHVESHSKAKILPTRLRSSHSKASKAAASESSQPPSPKKLKSRRNIIRKGSESGSIDAYFTAGNSFQLATQSTGQTSKLGISNGEEDLIEDDSFDDELRRLADPQKTGRSRNEQALVISQSIAESHGSKGLPTGSQIFRKPTKDAQHSEKNKDAAVCREVDRRPWADRYGPMSVEELAVHKRKVADVRGWLEAVCHGVSTKKLLVLKGAAGVGKTATIEALAGAMDLDVVEWKNPTVSDFASENYLSTSAQFEEFLGRSRASSSLQIASNENRSASQGSPLATQIDSGSTKKIIVVEEFPNISTSNTTALQLFRTSIFRYLARNHVRTRDFTSTTDNDRNVAMPLVVIVTESQLNNTTSINDSFTAHRLLGADVLNHPDTDVIEFNSIAPTYITKALNLVVQKEARDSGRRRLPGPSVLKRLSEVGDVRSAIGSLEFLCIQDNEFDDKGGRVASKGKKGTKNKPALTKTKEDSLELITQREASLGLFHALGKVVYNKRETPAKDRPVIEPPTQPPDHLSQHVRLKPPEISVDELVNETGTETYTFLAGLHENYVLSCAGNDFLDTLNACIEHLSDTDVLIGERGGKHRGNATSLGAAADSLKQDEIAFHVAVRGLLFSLPCPVTRVAPPAGMVGRNGGKGDAFKMFYPTSMRLGRQRQEIEELVERWMVRQRGSDPSTALFRNGYEDDRENDVVSWAQRTAQQQSGKSDLGASACITPSKDAMVLETLPYTAVIQRHRPDSLFVEELNRITRLTGQVQPVTEESLDELENKTSASKSDIGRLSTKPMARSDAIRPSAGVAQAAVISGLPRAVEPAVGHLYLSDDDIEDQ